MDIVFDFLPIPALKDPYQLQSSGVESCSGYDVP